MNKGLITNLIALLSIVIGYYLKNPIILSVGLFAFSGALTNWLAIHMLFEKVPGLVGTGVIPARFKEFKSAIKDMMMLQFFTDENIHKFLSSGQSMASDSYLSPVIEKVDLSPAFDDLVEVIMQSSFGGMLGMFGGKEALIPLKEPFQEKMKTSLINMTQTEEFSALLQSEVEHTEVSSEIKTKIAAIIDSRLEELTPQLVKQIIQDMIKQHLGWLVVWGGVFGGLIGFLSSLVRIN